MKTACSLALGLACMLALAVVATAEEKKDSDKEVKVTGTLTCAKCDLKKSDDCATVLVVKDKDSGKEVIYWLDKDSAKENHKPICQSPKKDVTITGTVTEEKDGEKVKKTIKVSKIDGLK